MTLAESSLKRYIDKSIDLAKKIDRINKDRESNQKKLDRVIKKRNPSKSDFTSIGRLQKKMIDLDKKKSKLTVEYTKVNKEIERYKKKVAQEQSKQHNELSKLIKQQSQINHEGVSGLNNVSDQITELAEAVKKSQQQKGKIEYDVFLSHSSLDKENYVSEISKKLIEKGFRVFEDVRVFKIGHSQTDMMNEGILNSKFVVVFLSKNFIKSGWSDYEFKGFLNREIKEERVIILPIWHEITYEEVKLYNPVLVDKFALSTDKFTIDEIVDRIS
ncbi:TIR domain-containing protein, partial [Staphylococcus pseudintermedius]|nr:TIR domain-containing protein [Staphylococcus pseudintermedius]